ncbi:hypothetical protein DL770_009773 [Monosporascus sp. CRB-9-2]|nr:hypothetical protein DL770_009773 [Monosporascus sp. CRB-9-2]
MALLFRFLLWSALWLAGSRAFAFATQVRKARATGLPYTLSPINELENLCYLTNLLLRWRYRTRLSRGEGWPRWARFMVKDWMYEDRGRAHLEFGEVFLVVSPGGIVCYVGNARTATNVCMRRSNFPKPREKMKMLEPFGPNVVSSNGDLWRLHLRTTVPSFGEGVNRLVWGETIRQTRFLMSAWSNNSSKKLSDEIFKLTLNVMCTCGFGQQTDWATDQTAVPSGHSMTLVNGVMGVVESLPAILLLPRWILKLTFKHAHECFLEVENYMHEFIRHEKARPASGINGISKVKGSLLTALISSNGRADGDISINSKFGRTAITDEEVMGNAFIFLLAGYDTTANTAIFCTIVLALYPHIQDKLTMEIDRIYDEAAQGGRNNLSYDEDLPKFRYILAFMYEVMRVFPIVLPLGRIAAEDQELVVESRPWTAAPRTDTPTTRRHVLPKGCGVIVNNTGIHYNPDSWVQPEVLDPRRWLSANPNKFDPAAILTEDLDRNTHSIPNHAKGTFLSFGEGPRACLGKRFSQVEFISFFATLLSEYRVVLGGTTPAAEVERIMRLRSGGSPVTLTPPEDVQLRLEKRR